MKAPVLAGVAFAFALAHGASGCARGEGANAFGLRRAEIRASGEASMDPIPAELLLGETAVRGHVSVSGEGSIDHLKPSYRFDPSEGAPPGLEASIKFSAQAQDPSFLRTLLGASILERLGIERPETEPVALYWNGHYLGLFLRIERIGEGFFRRRGEEPERLYKARARKARFDGSMVLDPRSGFESKLGGFHFLEVRSLALWAERGPGSDATLPALDFAATGLYFAAQLFLGNCDGLINNLYLAKLRGDPSLHFIPWDWERSFDGSCVPLELMSVNRLVARLLSDPATSNGIHAPIRRLLERDFPEETVRSILRREEARIREAYLADPYLGGIGRDPGREAESLLGVHRRWTAELAKALDVSSPRSP